MRRYKGTFDIFVGIEHRKRKEEMEEQFIKEAKQGWRFAANKANVTDEDASSEDRKYTSEGIFAAIDSNVGAVGCKEERAVKSIPGNGGRIAEALVNVRGGVRVFAAGGSFEAGENHQASLVGGF